MGLLLLMLCAKVCVCVCLLRGMACCRVCLSLIPSAGGHRSGQLLHVRKKDGRRQPLKVLNLVLLQSPSICVHVLICMYV